MPYVTSAISANNISLFYLIRGKISHVFLTLSGIHHFAHGYI